MTTKWKDIVFTVMALGLVVLVLQAVSYLIWVFVLEGPRQLATYEARMMAVSHTNYSKELGVVGPEPGVVLHGRADEFDDKFQTAGAGLGDVGVVGSGLDLEKEVHGLVFGDSFARGVGATDVLRFSWVENLERMTGIDFVNFSSLLGAPAQRSHHDLYRRIADAVPHQLVVSSLSTESDFLEVTQDVYLPGLLEQVPGSPEQYVRDWMRASRHDPGCEALAEQWLPFYPAILVQRILRHFPETASWGSNMVPDCPSDQRGQTPPKRFAERAGTYRQRILSDQGLDVPEVDIHQTFGPEGRRFRVPEYFRKPSLFLPYARAAAAGVNAFASEVRRRGKQFILVIHPSVELANWDRIPAGLVAEDPQYFTTAFKSLLDSEVRVIDISGALRTAGRQEAPLHWPIDRHYTPFGHLKAALAICERFRTLPETMPRGSGGECRLDSGELEDARRIANQRPLKEEIRELFRIPRM